jgi:arabinogalactan oligomer/maltooligosaccharide transport system permease protein
MGGGKQAAGEEAAAGGGGMHGVSPIVQVVRPKAWSFRVRLSTLPLVLVATSPLLVAGFAFSFNDFNTIFVLTSGGPINVDSSISAGATDILITLVYKQAFVSDTVDFGLASAFAVIIFLVITIMSVFLFRRTRALEEVY